MQRGTRTPSSPPPAVGRGAEPQDTPNAPRNAIQSNIGPRRTVDMTFDEPRSKWSIAHNWMPQQLQTLLMMIALIPHAVQFIP